MNKNLAIFPGSFDPITLGHVEVIKQSLNIFEKIIIAIGENYQKNKLFNLNERRNLINTVFKNHQNIIIKSYNELTVEFCQKENCFNIIRGIRNNIDFNYEHSIAISNNCLDNRINTIFIPSTKKTTHISSSIVKEIIANNGDLANFVPNQIITDINKMSN
ncbi:MAG: pantetheine-phosphate adenylyltransferase [Flavobacteriales bacterium]|nr:pantetheine-phosphate adenylyltransferase [Flavobacteriales bacterium]